MIRVGDFFSLAKIGTVTCIYVSAFLGVMFAILLLAICFVIVLYVMFIAIFTVFCVRCYLQVIVLCIFGVLQLLLLFGIYWFYFI